MKINKAKHLLYFILFLTLSCSIKNDIVRDEPEYRVIGIKDGDTIEILYNGKSQIIRLAHIDCPEKKQPFGNAAKKYTSNLCFGKNVRIIPTGKKDRYKRLIAEVYVGSRCVNKALVKAGMAWHYTKYSDDTEYAQLEKKARQKRVGLWSDQNPVAPWIWRTIRKSTTPTGRK